MQREEQDTFPSSEAEASRESLKGLKSVSKTGAEWPLKRGMRSGSLPRSSRGMTANAPPPVQGPISAGRE